MSSTYVFDTEALIAFLYNESGHERVGTLLTDVQSGDANGLLATANATEVYYLVARFEGTADDTPTTASLRTADRDIRTLERNGLSIEQAQWRLAGEVKSHGTVSLADACAVALAHERNATLVAGGDDDFDDLPLDVAIERFRTHSV
ncbi:PIN domain-containing protein [Haloarcula sp. S1AR25-5A]|uniref:PIN domain-containing protein n=1 Tax=Haloarcula terrestris TaxID=2950533 RepID=A0AAE4JFE2_9EURY|nr:PIN domain-containing protein [Haloarcula terrestris]MDS0220072.1 PIN domain-containing protein [Haloarcula terrestris]